MDFFEKLNKKLDQGYKLTDYSCPICKKSVVFNPEDKSLFCINCNLPVKFEGNIQDNEQEEQKQQMKNNSQAEEKDNNSGYEMVEKSVNKQQIQSKSDDYAKKLSQKLLQGWAMLEDSCSKCYVPLMRSKSGEHQCVGCGWSKVIDMSKGQTLQEALFEERQEQLTRLYEQEEEDKKEQKKTKEVAKTQNKSQPQKQSKPEKKVQAEKQQQENEEASEFGEVSETKQVLQGTLAKIARFYDEQIDICIQNNQISQVDFIVQNNLKNLIELSKKL